MAIKLRIWLVISLAGLLQLAFIYSHSNHYYQVNAATYDYEPAGGGPPASAADKSKHQSNKQNYYPTNAQANYYNNSSKGNASNSGNPGNQKHAAHQKCARQSIILARQMLAHELDQLNQFNSFWFSDLDRDELIEGQKHSLSNIVMSGASTSLLNSNGQPLIEIESSYFRQPAGASAASHHQTGQHGHGAPQGSTVLHLLRKHHDKCHLNLERGQFSYTVGLSIGPIEHHLDVIYNLPKELRLSQPIDWRYGQITIQVPKMHYEVVFKQTAGYKLNSSHTNQQQWAIQSGGAGCPLEVSDVTYLASTNSNSYPQYPPQSQQPQPQQRSKYPAQGQGISITSSGLALNNQTQLQIERLFDDYTRPTVSHRLRQMLKFYLNSKTFPLAAAAATTTTTTS